MKFLLETYSKEMAAIAAKKLNGELVHTNESIVIIKAKDFYEANDKASKILDVWHITS